MYVYIDISHINHACAARRKENTCIYMYTHICHIHVWENKADIYIYVEIFVLQQTKKNES